MPSTLQQPYRLTRRIVALTVLVFFTSLASVGPSAAEEGSPETEPAPAVKADATDGDRPPSANELYVAAAYQALLRRPADDEGAAFWLDTVVAGGDRSREKLSSHLLFSVEGASNEVVRAYQDLLLRFPESEGWNYWTDILQTERVDTLRSLILSSDEYINLVGGQSSYVNALYLELLDRPPEPEGLAFWNSKLEQGEPRQFVVLAIYQSDEGLANRASSYYQDFLDRPATDAEREAGANIIRQHGERAFFAKVFASDEYYEQFFLSAFGS